jgi:cellulose synthase operon protein C
MRSTAVCYPPPPKICNLPWPPAARFGAICNLQYFIAALFFLAGFVLALPLAKAGPAEDQYAVAAGHYKQKRWKFAAEEFQAFLDQNSQHASAAKARFYLAESLLQLRRFDEAAAAFRAFATQAPQDKLANKARFRAGEAKYLAGHFDEAQTELARFYEDLPDEPLNAYVLTYLGDIADRRSDFKLARHFYNEALRRFPQGPLADDCRFGLARALEAEGVSEEARRLYLALAAKPTSRWADKSKFRLAASYYAAGDYEQALACFQELLNEPRFAASPLRVKAALAAAESLYELNQFDRAGEQLQPLLDDKAVAVEARYWLGLVQAAQRDWLKAADTLLMAVEQASGDDKLAAAGRFQAGDALLHGGKVAEAQAQFNLVIRSWPTSEYAEKSLLGLMQADFVVDDQKSLDGVAAQFVERYPKSSLKSQVDRLLARSLLKRKEFSSAAARIEPLLAANAGDSVSQKDADRCLLAAAYIGLGRFDDALQTLDSVSSALRSPLAPQAEPSKEQRNRSSTSSAAAPAAALPRSGLQSSERQLWIDIHRERATALIGLERFADALPLLEQVLTTRPEPGTTVWAQAELAVCLAKTQQLERAKAIYNEKLSQVTDADVLPAAIIALADSALALNDAAWASELFGRLAGQKTVYQARALWGLAQSLTKQGGTSQVAAALDRLLGDYPDDPLAPKAAIARGQLLEQLNKVDLALRSYRQVIDKYASSPELAAALLAAARIEHRLKRPEEAAVLYEQLDRGFPALSDRDAVLYEWAWALRESGNLEKADELFERLRSTMPKGRFWADAVYRLAERAYEGKDYSRASQVTNELIAAEPGEQVLPHALYLEAQIAAAQNEWPRVTAPLQRLVAEFPDNSIVPLAQYLMAEAAYREGEFERAAEAFRELAESIRGRHDKWMAMIPLRRAQILARNKEWHDALEMASQIETDFPDFDQQYEVDYVVGRCHANLGEFDEARAAYGRVVKSETGAKTETAAKAQWMIGESFFHQKNYEAALRAYLPVEILYDFPIWQAAALFEAAKCHEHLGEPKQATELYEKIVKSYPDSPLAKDAAKRLKGTEARAEK